MFKWLRNNKGWVTVWLVVALISASMGILQPSINVQEVTQDSRGSLTVGMGSLEGVVTVGHIAYAAGDPDFLCDGIDDDVQLKAAVDTLPTVGGRVQVLAGTYHFSATVTRAVNNITIECVGLASHFTYDAVNPIFTAGGNGWVFRNLSTDAGGINVGATTGWSMENVRIGTTYYAYRTASDVSASSWDIPSGRGATYIVAASDAPAHVIAQADYVCDGTDDDVQIQAALTASTDVLLTVGNYTCTSNLLVPANTYLHGTNKYESIITASGASISNAGAISITGSNVEISDLKVIIEAGAGAGGTRPNAIAAVSKDYLYIHDCILVGDKTVGDDGLSARQVGVYLQDSLGSHISNNWISGFQRHGIYIASSATLSRYCIISDNHVSSTFYHNYALGGYFCLMVNNTSIGNVGASGFLLIGGRSNTVIGNTSTTDNIGFLANSGCTDSIFSGNVADTPVSYAFQCSGGGTTRNKFDGNVATLGGATKWSEDTGATGNTIINTTGYIAKGEVRTASGALTAGVANAIAFAWHNPEAQDILIKKVVIEVTTPGGTAGSHLDVGIADDAAGTNRGTEFFNDLLLNSAQVNDSWIVGTNGTQTVWVFCQDSASATDGWVVGQILDANAAALVGEYYIEYVGR